MGWEEGHCPPAAVNWYSVVPLGSGHTEELQRLLWVVINTFLHIEISKPKVRREIVCKNYKTWEVLGLLSKASFGTCMEQRQKEAALSSVICGMLSSSLFTHALLCFTVSPCSLLAAEQRMDSHVTECSPCSTDTEQHYRLVLTMVQLWKIQWDWEVNTALFSPSYEPKGSITDRQTETPPQHTHTKVKE